MMDRLGIVGVRVRAYLLISSSTVLVMGRVSGTIIAYSRNITLPFPPLMMEERSVLCLEACAGLPGVSFVRSGRIFSELREVW